MLYVRKKNHKLLHNMFYKFDVDIMIGSNPEKDKYVGVMRLLV